MEHTTWFMIKGRIFKYPSVEVVIRDRDCNKCKCLKRYKKTSILIAHWKKKSKNLPCLIITIQNHEKNKRISTKNPVLHHSISAAFQLSKRETLPFRNFPQHKLWREEKTSPEATTSKKEHAYPLRLRNRVIHSNGAFAFFFFGKERGNAKDENQFFNLNPDSNYSK